MLGSLDCMHVCWKNCPITYQGAYQGKEMFSTLVLEAIADHNLWFWHAVFGFVGSCNDINILNVSPLHQVSGYNSTAIPTIQSQKVIHIIVVDTIHIRYTSLQSSIHSETPQGHQLVVYNITTPIIILDFLLL